MIINKIKTRKSCYGLLLLLVMACSAKGYGQTGLLFYHSAKAFIDDNKFTESLRYFALDSAINLNNKKDTAYAYRGCAKMYWGDIEGAIKDFDTALFYNNRSFIAYAFRGIAKKMSKDYNGAIEDLTKAIGLNPKEADFYYNRARAELNIDKKQQAYSDFIKARDLGNSDAKTFLKQYFNK